MRGKTGLAGLLVVVGMAVVDVSLLSFPVGCRSVGVLAVAVLVAVEATDCSAALVCMDGPSVGVASEKKPLRNLMGRSAALCMLDSLKTTSALRTTCMVSGSQSL